MRPLRVLAVVVVSLLAVLATATHSVLAKGGTGKPPAGTEKPKKVEKPKPFKVGEAVSGVSVSLAAGGTWSQDSARGKFAVISFQGAASDAAFASFAKLQEALTPLGDKVTAIGVISGVEAAKVTAAIEKAKEKPSIPVGVDADKSQLAKFASSAPFVAILDAQGKLLLASKSAEPKAIAAKIKAALEPKTGDPKKPK